MVFITATESEPGHATHFELFPDLSLSIILLRFEKNNNRAGKLKSQKLLRDGKMEKRKRGSQVFEL